MTPGPNKEPISPSDRDKWSSEHSKQLRVFTKAAALSQKTGCESGDRLYTLCKMQEMPTDIKRGETYISHFVTPDCARVCVQVTGWQVAHLWSWSWHIWKMVQTQGQLNSAESAERKKTLLILRRNGSEYWQKVILPLVKNSLHSMSVSLKAWMGGWWEWPTGWLRSGQLTEVADEFKLSAHIMSNWRDVAVHHVTTWIMRLNAVTTPWIH